jgi:DNA-binding NarL/FixJ family response regulator
MREHTALLVSSDECGWTELRLALSSLPNVQIIGEATDIQLARRLAMSRRPTVVITTTHIEGSSILPFLTELRARGLTATKIVLVANRVDAREVADISELDVAGHLLWGDLSIPTLQHCLAATIGSDLVVASREVVRAFVEVHRTKTGMSDVPIMLSEREHAVLLRLAEGLTHEQIAVAEPMSRRTVDRIVARLQVKLDVPNSFVLGSRASQLGLLP